MGQRLTVKDALVPAPLRPCASVMVKLKAYVPAVTGGVRVMAMD